MSATGLDVFDRTVQTTNIWLNEISEEIGPDRKLAWHVLGTVLRALRDHIPGPLGAHLAAELPLLVRGAYYDQYRPSDQPVPDRDLESFLQGIAHGLEDARPVSPQAAVTAVFGVLSHHLPAGQVEKARQALPKEIRPLWPDVRAAALRPRTEPGRGAGRHH